MQTLMLFGASAFFFHAGSVVGYCFAAAVAILGGISIIVGPL